MENRKQKFEELYKQYQELVIKTTFTAQNLKKGIDPSKIANTSLGDERKRLAKELIEKYLDFVKALPSTEKIYKDYIEKDYEDSKQDI